MLTQKSDIYEYMLIWQTGKSKSLRNDIYGMKTEIEIQPFKIQGVEFLPGEIKHSVPGNYFPLLIFRCANSPLFYMKDE